MLYLLYDYLEAHRQHLPFINLLHYLTFRSAMALFTGQIVAISMGSRFIRWMKVKQGKGQPIRAEGIERHVIEKKGTPTMGGFMILAGRGQVREVAIAGRANRGQAPACQ